MLIEAFYILFFYFTGEFISYFIDGFIPGSVIQSRQAEQSEEALHASDRKHGVVFPAGGCGINEFARYHFPVLGCDRNSLRCQHHTRNCQRSTHPAKIRKGNGRK